MCQPFCELDNPELDNPCRLYWYRGVTVLLPGWVIWKYWNCPRKFFSLGSWLVSALSTPNGGEGYNSSTDLNPNTITSIQLHCIQASRPHLAEKTTRKPQPKYCMYQSSPHQPPYCTCTYIWNKYPKRVALATKYLKKNCSMCVYLFVSLTILTAFSGSLSLSR